MIQFTSNGNTVMAIPVPADAYDFHKANILFTWSVGWKIKKSETQFTHSYKVVSETDNFEILGTWTEKEGCGFDVNQTWVEMHSFNGSANRIRAFKDYSQHNTWNIAFKAHDSFSSLIQSEINKAGLTGDNFLIIKMK